MTSGQKREESSKLRPSLLLSLERFRTAASGRGLFCNLATTPVLMYVNDIVLYYTILYCTAVWRQKSVMRHAARQWSLFFDGRDRGRLSIPSRVTWPFFDPGPQSCVTQFMNGSIGGQLCFCTSRSRIIVPLGISALKYKLYPFAVSLPLFWLRKNIVPFPCTPKYDRTFAVRRIRYTPTRIITVTYSLTKRYETFLL